MVGSFEEGCCVGEDGGESQRTEKSGEAGALFALI
jgi:hypothetical protein